MIILYSSLKGKEFFHFLVVGWHLKSTLKKKTGAAEDFLIEAQEKSIKDYEKLTSNTQRGFIYLLLKIIKIDYFYPMFLTTFLTGIFFIFLSLVDLQSLIQLFHKPN